MSAQALAFSTCVRAHGVPDFPDPGAKPTGPYNSIAGIAFPTSIDTQSPAFRAAMQSCGNLLPSGGRGSGQSSAQAEAQTLQLSKCMRQHGISDFPDPQAGSPPSKSSAQSSGYGAVRSGGGVFLAIPSSIDTQSPAFKQAASACRFL